MKPSFKRKAFVRSAVCIAALLGAFDSASAAVYRTRWDPLYVGFFDGFPFRDPGRGDSTYLYYSGSATANTGACNADGVYTPAMCPGMAITNVVMQLSLPAPTAPIQTLNFPAIGTDVPTITSMTILGGNLVSVNAEYYQTGIQGAIPATLLALSGTQPSFSTSFVGGTVVLGFKLTASNTELAWACTSEPGSVIAGNCGADGTNITWVPVPEPETYAMLLAGLGLMGYVARRRKQKRA